MSADTTSQTPLEQEETPVASEQNESTVSEQVSDTPVSAEGAVGSTSISKSYRISPDLLHYIPRASAELYKMIPLKREDDTLYVGAVNPDNLDARDALNFITTSQNIQYEMQQIDEETLTALLEQYSDTELGNVEEALGELEDGEGVLLGVDDEDIESLDSAGLIREEAPVIKLVSSILAQAVTKRVSDIHVEPGEKQAVVRFRLDGILQDRLQFPRTVHESFVARVKILSGLRIDERRRPQDGRFSSRIKDSRVDFRVAIFPTVNGEKIILRVLDRDKGLRSLSELGFEEWAYKRILEAVKRPYGLILSTGPTGAGKTTTLYSILAMSDRKNQNIISLEDPVEYRLERVNQSSIRPEIGYTFATGLRSVLRADPDQIFVGEIRDKETAQLAVQAALTGHLVYSTLHTNSAIGAVSRLINFGVDPFLLTPTLSLVIGQRMVRRLDGDGKEVPITESMRGLLEKRFADLPQAHRSKIPEFSSFREAIPTDSNPTGMRGRIGVFEVFEVDDEVRSIIFEDPAEAKIYAAARKNGFLSMAEDALVKGLKGLIPYSEAMKISNEVILSEEVST